MKVTHKDRNAIKRWAKELPVLYREIEVWEQTTVGQYKADNPDWEERAKTDKAFAKVMDSHGKSSMRVKKSRTTDQEVNHRKKLTYIFETANTVAEASKAMAAYTATVKENAAIAQIAQRR